MAIEHSLLIKGNMVSMDKIIQYCQNKGVHYKVQSESEIYLDRWEMNVWSLKSSGRYNSWCSCLAGEDFHYDATVSFRLGKNPDYSEEQKRFVLDFVFDIMKETRQEVLFLYCGDRELCFFKSDGSVQIDDEYGILRNYIRS